MALRALRASALSLSFFTCAGNFFPWHDITENEGLIARHHARRTARIRSKLGGSSPLPHERHIRPPHKLANPARISRFRLERRAPHACLLPRLPRSFQRTLPPLQTTHLWLLSPSRLRSRPRRGAHPGNFSRASPRR